MSVQSVDIRNAFKKSQFTFFNIKEAQIELLPVSGEKMQYLCFELRIKFLHRFSFQEL